MVAQPNAEILARGLASLANDASHRRECAAGARRMVAERFEPPRRALFEVREAQVDHLRTMFGERIHQQRRRWEIAASRAACHQSASR